MIMAVFVAQSVFKNQLVLIVPIFREILKPAV